MNVRVDARKQLIPYLFTFCIKFGDEKSDERESGEWT